MWPCGLIGLLNDLVICKFEGRNAIHCNDLMKKLRQWHWFLFICHHGKVVRNAKGKSGHFILAHAWVSTIMTEQP